MTAIDSVFCSSPDFIMYSGLHTRRVRISSLTDSHLDRMGPLSDGELGPRTNKIKVSWPERGDCQDPDRCLGLKAIQIAVHWHPYIWVMEGH